MYDVRNLLKRFGIFIYTGDRLGDLEIMSDELRELYDLKLIRISTYQTAQLIIRKEKGDVNRLK